MISKLDHLVSSPAKFEQLVVEITEKNMKLSIENEPSNSKLFTRKNGTNCCLFDA